MIKNRLYFVLIEHDWLFEQNKNAHEDCRQLLEAIDKTVLDGVEEIHIQYCRTDIDDKGFSLNDRAEEMQEDIISFFEDPFAQTYCDEKEDEEESSIDLFFRQSNEPDKEDEPFVGSLLCLHVISDPKLYHLLCKMFNEFLQDDLYEFYSFSISYPTFCSLQKTLMLPKPKRAQKKKLGKRRTIDFVFTNVNPINLN